MTLTEMPNTFKNKLNPSKVIKSLEKTLGFYDGSDMNVGVIESENNLEYKPHRDDFR